MTNNRDAKKKDLRDRLIAAAESLIAQNGLSGLKARDVTRDAGCSLGTIYNVVQDLDELIMLVNSRTLGRLGQVLRDTVSDSASPTETMQALARAYVDFAQSDTALWSTLFNHRLPKGVQVPDWHAQEYAVLIQEIIAPLANMRPDLTPNQLKLRGQTLFAAVHGVVQLSIHGQFVGAPRDVLADEVEALVEALTRGRDGASQ